MDGIYRNTNDEVFLSAIKERIQNEEGLEITDEDIVSIINTYGEISFAIEISGGLSTQFNKELLITEEKLGDRDEDAIYQMNESEKARVSALFTRACKLEVDFFDSVYAHP